MMKPWLVICLSALALGGCCTDWEGEQGQVKVEGVGQGDAPAADVGGEGRQAEAHSGAEAADASVGRFGAGEIAAPKGEPPGKGAGGEHKVLSSEMSKSDAEGEAGKEGRDGEAGEQNPRRLKIVAAYTTRLGRLDHYNERKERLEDAAAIVAQDRVNYHKRLGRDALDQGDPLYHDRNARVELSELIGAFLADKAPISARILRGKPVVRVIVSESPVGKRVARVDILRP